MRVFLAAALVAVIGVSQDVRGGVLKSSNSVILKEEPKTDAKAEAAKTDDKAEATKKEEAKPLTPEQAVKKIAKIDPTVLNKDGKPTAQAATADSKAPKTPEDVKDEKPSGNTRDSTPHEHQSAAKKSSSYQDFRESNPLHPAYPNSADREVVTYVVGFVYFFALGFVVFAMTMCSMVYFDNWERYFQQFSPNNKKTIAALLLPFIAIWLFAWIVMMETWKDPVRNHTANKFTPNFRHYSSKCSEMLGFLLVAPMVGAIDLSAQLYFRFRPSVEMQSVSAVSLLTNIAVNSWGAYVGFHSRSENYCDPLLRVTTCIFSMMSLIVLGCFGILIVLLLVYRSHGRMGKRSKKGGANPAVISTPTGATPTGATPINNNGVIPPSQMQNYQSVFQGPSGSNDTGNFAPAGSGNRYNSMEYDRD